MKRICLIVLLLAGAVGVKGQSTVADLILSGNVADSIKKAAIKAVFQNPDLYNDEFAKFVGALKPDTGVYNFMRDLNLKFKTFQAADEPAALGFEYKYDNSWTKNTKLKSATFIQSYNINLDGNVAFKKIYNPADFLESKFVYNASFMWGGIAKKNDAAAVQQLRALEREIIKANEVGNGQLLEQLYIQKSKLIGISNQYYIGINGSAGYESNQDLSKTQFVPGLLVNLGAKAWDPNEALRYFNLPDYPFALIRLITGTDKKFTISGASFPSALLGIDYVNPGQDSLRKAVTGSLNSFTRFRFEAAFKTKFAVVYSQVIYFSSDFRFYKELNASAAVNNAGIGQFTYFVATLESSNGFFVHYTSGRLPFDRKNDNTYGIGFHYDLGNWK